MSTPSLSATTSQVPFAFKETLYTPNSLKSCVIWHNALLQLTQRIQIQGFIYMYNFAIYLLIRTGIFAQVFTIDIVIKTPFHIDFDCLWSLWWDTTDFSVRALQDTDITYDYQLERKYCLSTYIVTSFSQWIQPNPVIKLWSHTHVSFIDFQVSHV